MQGEAVAGDLALPVQGVSVQPFWRYLLKKHGSFVSRKLKKMWTVATSMPFLDMEREK